MTFGHVSILSLSFLVDIVITVGQIFCCPESRSKNLCATDTKLLGNFSRAFTKFKQFKMAIHSSRERNCLFMVDFEEKLNALCSLEVKNLE